MKSDQCTMYNKSVSATNL